MAVNPGTGRPYTREELQALLDQTGGDELATGRAAGQDYLAKARDFDATGAVNRYAQGAWGSISTALDQKLKGLSGQAVGADRFDSGFYDEDQGTVVRGALQDFSNAVAQQSVAAAGLQQRNTEGLGAYGQRSTEAGLGLLGDRYTQEENDYREEQARKRSRRSGIGSAIGGIIGAGAGSIIPGLGTGIGASLGSALGGAF